MKRTFGSEGCGSMGGGCELMWRRGLSLTGV